MMENEGWPVKYQQSGANDSTTPSVSSLNNGESNNDEKICATAAAAAAAANSIDEKPKLPIDPGEPINNTPTISDKASQLIPIILDQMKEFSNTEKYILYLKLFQISNVVDPLRQPLNPLGSRSEINRTISWIKTHLEEDPETSLPKQQVYEEYSDYCMSNQIKSLSQADFGKVMKQVYPKVRARRLGTRGNSRYCYSGLRRCMKLKAPQLPDLADKPLSTEEPCTLSNLTAASWLIVKEWSEIHFGVQFSSLQALARFLVVNHAIGVGTAAANQLTSAAETQICGDFNLISNNCKNTHSKHREMQLQLQKKIQQKSETGKEQQPQQQQQRKRKSTSTPNSKSDSKLKKCRSASLKLTTATTTISPIGVGGESSTTSTISSTSTSPTTQGNNNNNNKPICDKSSLDFTTNSTQQQLAALPDFKSFQKAPTVDTQQQQQQSVGKVAIPRLTTTSGFKQHHSSPQQQQSSPKKQQQQNVKNSTNKYKAIQPKPQQQQQQQQTQCDNASYNPHVISNNADNIRSQGVVTVLQHNNNVLDRFKDLRKSSSDCENNDNNCDVSNDDDAPSSVFPLPRERLDSISNVDKDAMDEYLGTNNSQHEEELSKYFSSSSSNNNDQSTSDNSTKLSQLRQLLEQHGVAAATVVAAAAVTKILDSSSTTAAATTTTNNISSSSSSTTTLIDPLQMAPITNVNQAAIFVAGGASNGNNSNLIIPTNCNSNSSARRRVSFETPTIATTINHLQQQLQKDDVVVNSNMNNVVVSCGVGNVVGCGIGIAGGGIGVVPPSPNTRRKNFSFTPISPGPQSPINNNNNNNISSNNNNNSGRQSKCSSTNVSPFVSPRNTPIPRNKNTNHHQTAAAANLLANRIATTTNNNNKIIIKREHQQINELNGLELLTDNDNKVYNLMSSAPASPMLPQTNNPFNTTTTTTITADNKSVLEKLLHSSGKITYNTNYNSSIQIKSDLSAPTSNEISEFLHNHHQNDPFLYRSQSVPLSQMIKSDFIDDTATANSTTNQFSDFNDYDPIPESAATVDRIINSLDEQQQGNGTANPTTSPDVDPFLSQRFDLMSNNNLLNNNLLFGGPCATTQRATLSRSQSIDVKYNEGGGCFDIIPNKYPSRSVPSTPLSFNQKLQQQHQLGFVVGGGGGGTNASRSYPSTPALIENNLTADQPIFNYNNVVVNNSDCLLNGQPIRSAANVATAPGPADANLFSTNIFGGGSSGGGGDVVVDNNIDGHLVSNDDDVEFGAFDGANGAAGLMDENDVLIVEGNFDAN